MTEEFRIRFQLIELNSGKVYDHFDMEIPEYSWGVTTSKSETPFLVAQNLFNKMRKRLKK